MPKMNTEKLTRNRSRAAYLDQILRACKIAGLHKKNETFSFANSPKYSHFFLQSAWRISIIARQDTSKVMWLYFWEAGRDWQYFVLEPTQLLLKVPRKTAHPTSSSLLSPYVEVSSICITSRTRDLILGVQLPRAGKKPWEEFWPLTGSWSPNRIRGNVSKWGKGSIPFLFSDSVAPALCGQRSWFKFPNVWYSRKKVGTRTRANLIWSGNLQCKSTFKGQRPNVVSTAPGEAVGENLQCGNARLQGVWNNVHTRARERIWIVQSISTEESQKIFLILCM